MSQQVGQQLAAAGLEENKAYVVGRLGVKGLQLGCLAATPIYAIQSIRKGGFSLRGLLRYNWFVPVLGAGAGATAGFIQTSQMDHPTLAFKATDFRMDADRVRQDDMHLIGSVIGALVLPALFLKRVGLINGLLGGAGLGGAAAIITHRVQKLQKDNVTKRGLEDAVDNVKAKAGTIKDEAKGAFEQAKEEAKSRV